MKQATRITQGRDGWEASTTINLYSKNRVLVIRTAKTTGGLVNSFTVQTEQGNGSMVWEMFGDYSNRTVFKGSRCTEKTVRELHAQALRVSDLHMSDAAKFYAAKEPKPVFTPEAEPELLTSYTMADLASAAPEATEKSDAPRAKAFTVDQADMFNNQTGIFA